MYRRKLKLRFCCALKILVFTALSLRVFTSTTPCAANQDLNSQYISLYANLLDGFTRETNSTVQTRVDYRGLRKQADWKRLIARVEQTDPSQLATRNQRLAYWINVYNIFAIDLVLAAYPVESIKDIGSFFTSVWKLRAGKIRGRSYTLDEIEHKILRPMGDPRIHGAIVCASVSCPPLARTPYTPDTLDQDLDANLKRWLANPQKGSRVDRATQTLHLSQIFDWFESDFEATGGVLEFVASKLAEDLARWIRSHRGDLRVEYFDYDWGLNE